MHFFRREYICACLVLGRNDYMRIDLYLYLLAYEKQKYLYYSINQVAARSWGDPGNILTFADP